MQASAALINAFGAQTLEERLTAFDTALSYNSFAHQEIVEQLAQQIMGVAQGAAQQQSGITPELFTAFKERTETELSALAASKPGDARLHVFLASYYRSVGDLEKAKEQLLLSREFSPRKQAIILQQGAVEIAAGDNEGAKGYFQEAYDLEPSNLEAAEYYIATLFYAGERELALSLIDQASASLQDRLANSDFVLGAVNNAKDFETLAKLYEIRVISASTTAQNWASLAFTYYQMKDIDKAVSTLARGSEAVPSFASTATCVTANLKAGRSPEVGCE